MNRPHVRSPHRPGRDVALVLLLVIAPACSDDSPNEPKPVPNPTRSALVVHTPARGAMIQEGTQADASVTLSGMAQDSTNTITSLVIDGQAVAVSGSDHEVAFSVQQQSRWGLSLVTGQTTNSGGGRGEVAQSYLRSPAYFPPLATSNAGARVPEGLVTRLRQTVLDDGDRADVDDLATVVNRLLTNQNWNSFVPACLTASNAGGNCIAETADLGCNDVGYAIAKNGALTVNSIRVDQVHLTGGSPARLTEQLRIAHPRLPVRVTGAVQVLCVGTSASVTGAIAADELVMTFTHGLGVNAAGEIVLQSPSVSTQWTNARVDVEFGVLSFLGPVVGDIASAGLNAFQGIVADMVSDSFRELLPGAFESVSTPSVVQLPAPIGSTIQVHSVFSSAGVAADHVSLGLATQFYPTAPAKNLAAMPYGALRKDGASATFPAAGYSFGVGAKDDAVNQFLWAAWAGGAFDIDAMIDDACFTSGVGTIVSIEALLPPVIMPGTNGHDLDVGFGDLVVAVDLAPAFATGAHATPGSGAGGAEGTARAWLHVSWLGGASLDLDPATNELVPALDPSPEFAVQVGNAVGAVDPAIWRDVVASAVRCEYARRIEEVVNAFPVPRIDIGAVPGVAPGTLLGLSDGAIERVGDYSILTGSVAQK